MIIPHNVSSWNLLPKACIEIFFYYIIGLANRLAGNQTFVKIILEMHKYNLLSIS